MKIRILCLSLTILIMILSSKAHLQPSKHNLTFHLGYGIGSPDIRYDFLYDQYPILIIEGVQSNLKEASHDDEFFLGISYNYQIAKRLNLGLGISYAQLKQDFFLPANGNSYFGAMIEPFFWRDTSQYHMIQMQPSIDVKLLNNSTILGINCTGISNISFRKHINSFNLSRSKTEYFSSEIYTGIYSEFKRIRLDVGYRILHWKYRDDAIANNGLRVDTYNLPKWRFQMSYELWRSKDKE